VKCGQNTVDGADIEMFTRTFVLLCFIDLFNLILEKKISTWGFAFPFLKRLTELISAYGFYLCLFSSFNHSI